MGCERTRVGQAVDSWEYDRADHGRDLPHQQARVWCCLPPCVWAARTFDSQNPKEATVEPSGDHPETTQKLCDTRPSCNPPDLKDPGGFNPQQGLCTRQLQPCLPPPASCPPPPAFPRTGTRTGGLARALVWVGSASTISIDCIACLALTRLLGRCQLTTQVTHGASCTLLQVSK